jgi:4-hydroxybenzoate polyprenyltransferase
MKWLQFILSHSIFIAICAAGLCLQTVQLLHLDARLWIYGFIFFATLCSYNFYWLLSKFSLRENAGRRIRFFLKESVQVTIFALSAAGTVICFLRSGLDYFIIVPAIALTVLYAVPLLPFEFLKFTRKIGVAKTVLLAFTWTYVTAFIPVQQPIDTFPAASIFVLSRRFLFMLMLCIIFDSRDVKMDKIRGLHSLATDLGPKTLRYLIVIIFIILFLTNFLCLHYGMSIAQSTALQLSTVALLATYFLSLKKQGYFFYYFFVDGLMLFSALATYIASIS